MRQRTLSLLGLAALVACGKPPEEAAVVEGAEAALRGGTVITGATGIVEILYIAKGTSNKCTGSMIGPRMVLTAAHCLETLGSDTMSNGAMPDFSWIFYHDPVQGRRTVAVGGNWFVFPTFNGLGEGGAGEANDDMALIVAPETFKDTDYHDYLRIYDDADGPLDANLTSYGVGIHSYSGATDDKLRTSWFEVEDVDVNHVVVDTRDKVSVCEGDSGGPIIKVASEADASLPLLVGVLSNSGSDPGGEGVLCSNNDPPNDNAYYARANAKRIAWIEKVAGVTCSRPESNSNLFFQRCFEPSFIEDLPGEGMTQDLEVAIVTAFL